MYGDDVTYKRPDNESRRSIVQEAIDTNIDGFDGFKKCDDHEEIEAGHNTVQVRFFSQQENILRSIMPQYIGNIVNNFKRLFSREWFDRKNASIAAFSHYFCSQKRGVGNIWKPKCCCFS